MFRKLVSCRICKCVSVSQLTSSTQTRTHAHMYTWWLPQAHDVCTCWLQRNAVVHFGEYAACKHAWHEWQHQYCMCVCVCVWRANQRIRVTEEQQQATSNRRAADKTAGRCHEFHWTLNRRSHTQPHNHASIHVSVCVCNEMPLAASWLLSAAPSFKTKHRESDWGQMRRHWVKLSTKTIRKEFIYTLKDNAIERRKGC